MTLDDLRRLFTRQTLFRLDATLAPRLVPIFYALGLAGLLLWAVRHFFASFATGFGNGLWGLLEIAVFGLLVMLGLRILCEALLVWFRTRAEVAAPAQRPRYSASLLDEVRDAIRDLAEHDYEPDFAEADEYITPVSAPAPDAVPAEATPAEPASRPGEILKPRSGARRTARRTPNPRT